MYLRLFAIIFKVLTKFIFVMAAFLCPMSTCRLFIKQCQVSVPCQAVFSVWGEVTLPAGQEQMLWPDQACAHWT
jgi:hypothetical protein